MDFSELPSGKLIVACYSGQTAGQTTAVLRMLGHDAVSLHYGMAVGWIAGRLSGSNRLNINISSIKLSELKTIKIRGTCPRIFTNVSILRYNVKL